MGHEISDIKAIGITNQRETTLVWDKETGKPLYNAIAWPDTRVKGLVREYKEKKGEKDLSQICGLPLSTYPSAMKLVWMIEHVPEVKEAYDAGRLCFGTVDTWLVYNLNGGKEKGIYVTDSTNASRTMFMNLHTVKYDDELLKFFGLDRDLINLPKIVPSSCADSYGSMAYGPLKGLKIAGVLGDQSAALVGQQGFTPGSAKNTYGTGCFLLYNCGDKPTIVGASQRQEKKENEDTANCWQRFYSTFGKGFRTGCYSRRQRRMRFRHRLLWIVRAILD